MVLTGWCGRLVVRELGRCPTCGGEGGDGFDRVVWEASGEGVRALPYMRGAVGNGAQ